MSKIRSVASLSVSEILLWTLSHDTSIIAKYESKSERYAIVIKCRTGDGFYQQDYFISEKEVEEVELDQHVTKLFRGFIVIVEAIKREKTELNEKIV